MYLARYASDDTAFVQGMVRIEGEPTSEPLRWMWAAQLDQLSETVHLVSLLGLALRITFAPGQPCSRLIVASVEAGASGRLVRWLAGFTRLERSGVVAVEPVREKQRFDALLADLPALRRALRPPALRAQEAWLVGDNAILSRLGEVARVAELEETALTWAFHLAPHQPDREVLRALRRNVLALERTRGLPGTVLGEQRAKADAYAVAGFRGEAYLAASGAGAFETLAGCGTGAAGSATAVEPVPLSADEEEGLLAGLPQSLVLEEDLAPADQAAQVVSDDVFRALIGWVSPAPRPAQSVGTEPDDAGAAAPRITITVEPYDGDAPFLFLSYARRDLDQVAAIAELVDELGFRLWYDRGIPGGVEWDARLEERLNACAGVLVVVSEAAAASRYVRREVKYADANGKSILPVALDDAPIRHGLGWLDQIQRVRADAPDLAGQLAEAIRLMLR